MGGSVSDVCCCCCVCVVSSLPTLCKVVPADYAPAFLIGGCPLQGFQKKTSAAQGPPLAAAAAEVQRSEEDILEGRQARTSRKPAEVQPGPSGAATCGYNLCRPRSKRCYTEPNEQSCCG